MSIIPFFGNNPLSIEILNPLFSSTQTSSSSQNENPRVDWKETPEAHVIIADLPGVKKEEVKVEVDGRVIQISGERKEEEDKDDKNVTWHRVERSRGKFMRRFRLPEDAKVDEMKASLENGVLVVKIPKQELKKPQVKVVQIEGGD